MKNRVTFSYIPFREVFVPLSWNTDSTYIEIEEYPVPYIFPKYTYPIPTVWEIEEVEYESKETI